MMEVRSETDYAKHHIQKKFFCRASFLFGFKSQKHEVSTFI
jgi:hypothetical protein